MTADSRTAQLGAGTVLPLAPLSLPYSPEFEPRPDPDEGRKTLREIARVTGGVERTTWDDVFSATRLRNRQVKDLVIPLTLLLLVLHVVEIGGRRLLLFDAARAWLRTVKLPRWRRVRLGQSSHRPIRLSRRLIVRPRRPVSHRQSSHRPSLRPRRWRARRPRHGGG